MQIKDSNLPIIVIGAGLSGTLLAIVLAQKGYQVQLFEKRPDMREVDISAGRSINLAISNRGLKALSLVDLEEEIKKLTIPMNGRLIHNIKGDQTLQPYSGRAENYINSISREGLNIALLNKASKMDNIDIVFNAGCTNVDLNNATVTISYNNGKSNTVKGLLVFGADGAGSSLRQSMMSHSGRIRFSFSQSFLAHGYKELSFPPLEGGMHCMDANALHIWPRGGFMLIALPNQDGSFTVTLFMPFKGKEGFDNIKTGDQIKAFFSKYFPDTLKFMPNLSDEYFTNPTGSLATIKCYPWQVNGKTLLIGDAAHAVVPFYGQGMNASFEDVYVLNEILEKVGKDDWEKVFNLYQETRKVDADAIGDMAEENYYEMRDHVSNEIYLIKRKIELQLEQHFSDYDSKYSLVSFRDDVPYSVAKKKGSKQDQYLMQFCKAIEDTESVDMEALFSQIQKYAT